MQPPLVSKLLDRVKILKSGQIFFNQKEGGPANDTIPGTIDSHGINGRICSNYKNNYQFNSIHFKTI